MLAESEKRRLEATEAMIKSVVARVGIHGQQNALLEDGRPSNSDYIVKASDGSVTVIAIKQLTASRPRDFQAQLSDGLVRLLRVLSDTKTSCPLLIVVVPEITELLKAAVYAFIEKKGQPVIQKISPNTNLSWLLVSQAGKYFGQVNGQTYFEQLPGGAGQKPSSFLDHYIEAYSSKRPRHVGAEFSHFTGNYQWMLKVMLLNAIDPRYWGAEPFVGQWNSNTLRARAGFNTATQAHALLTELEEAGHLVRKQDSIEFRNLRALMTNWIRAYRQEKIMLIPLAPLMPGVTTDQWREKDSGFGDRFSKAAGLANISILLGGHLGCYALGLGWTNNLSILIHASTANPASLERFLRAIELKVSDNRNSPIQLQPHRYEKPVLEVSELKRKNNLAPYTVDVIQCALDVSILGGRGDEQAEHIFEEALFPHFRRMGWSL